MSTTEIRQMPSPNLVYYIPNNRKYNFCCAKITAIENDNIYSFVAAVDMYKFEWGSGRRMPNWYINLDAKSQWIYFYGNRVTNIRQVI